MPYYNFRKKWTPLEMFRIYFYKETHEGTYWVKVGSQKRKKLF